MQLLQPIPIMPGPNQCRNTPRFPALWISGTVDFRHCGFPALWISGTVDFRHCGFPAPWISGTVAAEVTAELVALNLQPVAVTSIRS
jgi:hypothetical protein